MFKILYIFFEDKQKTELQHVLEFDLFSFGWINNQMLKDIKALNNNYNIRFKI